MEKTVQKSWIEYESSDQFPIQNLPYGVCKCNKTGQVSCFTRISNTGINLSVLEQAGLLDDDKVKFDSNTFNQERLNKFISLGNDIWVHVRKILTEIFTNDKYKTNETVLKSMVSLNDVTCLLPINIPDYTDFYSSRNHAYNVGSLFRPNNPLQPNWSHLPVGYHGRSSTIVVDGEPIRRPRGQIFKTKDAEESIFSECKRLDYEVEMGVVLGKSNEMGTPIKVNEAHEYIFGFVILNDWSARDIQAWEYVPLGPFTAKNFASTISAWIVTRNALEPFKITLPEQDPKPLKYLQENHHYSYDIPMNVSVKGKNQTDGIVLGTTNYKYMYWSATQQIAHHSVTGCKMNIGDLLGSGTISGTDTKSYGCLLELNKNGTQKLQLGEEERTWLLDEDYVNMTAICEGEGYRIGFGNCGGKILPALDENEYY